MAEAMIADIVCQHAEEAAFLWLLRDAATRAPHYMPLQLARLDNRVEAHLDGLRVAGDAGWNVVWAQAQERPEPGELFVASVLAFEGGKQDRIDQVLALAVTKPALRRAVVSALGWLPAGIALARLAALTSHASSAVRRIGLAGYAIRRLNPGTALEKALNDPDLELRARALKMVGEMGYAVWLPLLKKHLAIANLPCRFYAACSAALLAGDAAAVTELQTIALTESGYRQRAAEVVVRRMDVKSAQRWLAMLGTLPGAERLVIQGMTALGDPASIPQLLGWMSQPPLARLAGEAFTFITGVHPADQQMEGTKPEGFEAGPNEDALDENVGMDPDDGLPWPDAEKLARWWSANQGRFSKGTRHLLGRPIAAEWLQDVVQKQRQRCRIAAALELVILNPKQPMIEVRGRLST